MTQKLAGRGSLPSQTAPFSSSAVAFTLFRDSDDQREKERESEMVGESEMGFLHEERGILLGAWGIWTFWSFHRSTWGFFWRKKNKNQVGFFWNFGAVLLYRVCGVGGVLGKEMTGRGSLTVLFTKIWLWFGENKEGKMESVSGVELFAVLTLD